ncbi:MAG TPA: glycine betaine ABC transporter substrate-binding protein [Bryobacteraceae bacterium]|nr:glycine betaine ABC transporter substrate-binding protein [Bryobacteraceae bacterium]
MLNRVKMRKYSLRWRFPSVALGMLALLAGCGGSKKPVVVGAKSNTAQSLLGEIVAQHLEHRLGRKVGRNLSLGGTALAYQSLTNGEVGIYPEETATIQAVILKEPPNPDPASSLERGRNEMRRVAQIEVLDPLGVDDVWRIIVKKDQTFETLSEAQDAKPGWKLGVTRDFNERLDGLAALNQYRLPMGAVQRVSDAATLYAALESGELTMVAGSATDGPPSRHSDWKVLRDDKKVFASYQTCLMVRTDLILGDARIRPALAELSAKFTNESLSALAVQVDIDHRKPADVAAEFLTQAGLK